MEGDFIDDNFVKGTMKTVEGIILEGNFVNYKL